MSTSTKQGIFTRIFILYGAMLLLSVFIAEVFVTRAVKTSHINSLRDNLLTQAVLASRDVPFQSSGPLDDLCRRLKEMTRARVTIIAVNGRVIGDSDHDSSSMTDHSNRLEIQQAMLTGSGLAIRKSDTLKYELLYVAKQIVLAGKPQGFIRLSVPLKDVDASINLLRTQVIVMVSLMLLATGLFPLWQMNRLRRFTHQIRDLSSSLARGDVGQRLFLSRAGEFDEIAENLNTTSEKLKKGVAARDEEKTLFNAVLRSIPDALFIIDINGVILLSSAEVGTLVGEIAPQGRPFIEVLRNSEVLSLMEKVRRERTAGSITLKIESPLDQYFDVQVSPLFYAEHELSGFVAVFHDITRLQKLEQTRKDFVANISHEIKTPITAISGFAEILLDRATRDETSTVKFLETIRSNSERINGLVDDLMTISKFELGAVSVKKTTLRIEEIMSQVVDTLGEKASGKGLSLTWSLVSPVAAIDADRDKLIQILTNLTDNAIKFTEKGGIVLSAAEENGKTVLSVEDTGIGIPQKHLPRLGERFYRVDASRSRQMGGTGLGLAIVKHLVNAHGWDMQFQSTPGKGTTVMVIIRSSIPSPVDTAVLNA
jgi:two-component system phosphate regulon sensor histidine kinase PhoR